jgi:hypothetical protein
MSNIFIQYGRSTKRGSNLETGGFGLGAKSAFGYSDSFIINTFIDGIKRSYCAVIDETERGILQLMSEQSTTEKNGTEIIVPVKNKDINQFHSESISVVRHWKNPPIFKNINTSSSLEQIKVKPLLSGSRWFIEQNNRKNLYAVLDEIQYPIQETMIDFNSIKIGNCNLYLEFKTGELEVAPNRETLKQSESNKKKILTIVKVYEDEIKEILQKEIDKQESFPEAVVNFEFIRNKLNTRLDKDMFTWRGTPLIDQYIKLSTYGAYSCCYSTKPLLKLNKGTEGYYKIEKDTLYVETEREFNKTTEKALQAMLDKLKSKVDKYSKIWLINTKYVSPEKKEELFLNQIGAITLEKYYNFLPEKERKQTLSKTLFFKLTSSATFSEKVCDWTDDLLSPEKAFTRTSLAAFEEDKGNKAYLFLNDNKSIIIRTPNKYYYEIKNLEALKAITSYNIYGFKKSQVSEQKIVELMNDEGVLHVEDLINEEYNKKTKQEWNECVAFYNAVHSSYFEEISSVKLFPLIVNYFNVSRSNFSLLIDPEIQKVYLEHSPPFVKEYFEKLNQLKNMEINNTKYYRIIQMILDQKFKNEHSQQTKSFINEIRELKKQFNDYYRFKFIQDRHNYNLLELFEIINLIDTIKKIGYNLPVAPKDLTNI